MVYDYSFSLGAGKSKVWRGIAVELKPENRIVWLRKKIRLQSIENQIRLKHTFSDQLLIIRVNVVRTKAKSLGSDSS